MSAWTGHHFARPGNRFWPALHASGFTPRRFAPAEQAGVLELGFGITNVAARATARADELTAQELVEGGRLLRAKVAAHRPAWLAVLGVTAYRVAFDDRAAQVGPQSRTIGTAQEGTAREGTAQDGVADGPGGRGATRIWVLPSPSGLNAHWSPAALAEEFARLRSAAYGAEPVAPHTQSAAGTSPSPIASTS
ncbi:mismatch-specific DNA-glycosylase [Actinacidiphila polyblastidii]